MTLKHHHPGCHGNHVIHDNEDFDGEVGGEVGGDGDGDGCHVMRGSIV